MCVIRSKKVYMCYPSSFSKILFHRFFYSYRKRVCVKTFHKLKNMRNYSLLRKPYIVPKTQG